MNYVFEVATKQQWDDLDIDHWQHSWEYGDLQKESSRTVSQILIHNQDTNKFVGYFQIITYPLFRNKTISYIPYGPVFTDTPNAVVYKSLKLWLRTYANKHNSICVRTELASPQIGFLRTPLFAYHSSFHQPRGEALLNLSPSLAEIRDNYSKSTKRNIKKAVKNNLLCSHYHGAKMRDWVKPFIQLNNETTTSHHTTTHPDSYFELLFATLSLNKDNFVSVVTQDKNVLAINIFTVFNNHAYCPFGASSSTGKQLGAYYWIKDQSIAHLHQRGIEEFNWGGIAIGKNDDNLQSLNQFKLGWGSKEKHHADFYDLVCSWWYWLYLGRKYFS